VQSIHPSIQGKPECEKFSALASSVGLGGLVRPAGHLAKIIHKVGGETLEAGKAVLGIKGK
jgi:hypothetical protein